MQWYVIDSWKGGSGQTSVPIRSEEKKRGDFPARKKASVSCVSHDTDICHGFPTKKKRMFKLKYFELWSELGDFLLLRDHSAFSIRTHNSLCFDNSLTLLSLKTTGLSLFLLPLVLSTPPPPNLSSVLPPSLPLAKYEQVPGGQARNSPKSKRNNSRNSAKEKTLFTQNM